LVVRVILLSRPVGKSAGVTEGRGQSALFGAKQVRVTSPIESPDGAELLVITVPMYARSVWQKAKKDLDIPRLAKAPAELAKAPAEFEKVSA
jgi:hypothetical protein